MYWPFMLRNLRREQPEYVSMSPPCQLLSDRIAPLPMKAGKAEKQDYEYVRQGTAVILLAYDLNTAQRYV